MATSLPTFPSFDMHSDGAASQRWEQWIGRLENLFVALNITNAERKRALLLHYAGEEVYDVFQTLTNTGNDFATAKAKLTEYFEPKKNVAFSVYSFCQGKQRPDERIDEFIPRMRQMAKKCNLLILIRN